MPEVRRRFERVALALVRGRGLPVVLVGSLVLVAPVLTIGLGSTVPDAPIRVAVAALVYGGGLMSLVLGHGLVAGAVRSGTAVLWLQKSRWGPGFFLGRFVVLVVVTTLVTVFLGLAVAAVTGLLRPGSAGPLLQAVPSVVLGVFLLQCLLLACSGWGLHPDSLAAALLLPVLVGLALAVTLRPGLFGGALPLARMTAFPLDALEGVGRLFGTGEGSAGPGALARVLSYGLGWVLLGLLGIVHTTRHPVPGARGRHG